MIRVLIVDDERPARDGLRLRLEGVRGFELVGEAASGRAAVAAVLRLEPDLMFLDIRMPDMNGFEVLRAIPAERRPRVVFVTAYNRHALRAFEVHALDYLLKPIAKGRFEATLERARSAHARALATHTLDRLARELRRDREPAPPRRTMPDRLAVRDGNRYRLVPVSGIHWIEARGNYVALHGAEGALVHRATLGRLEGQLPRDQFARVHRGAIVNVAEVTSIRPGSHGDGEIVLRSGVRLRMSRRYRDALLPP